jgi:hypothetical protein
VEMADERMRGLAVWYADVCGEGLDQGVGAFEARDGRCGRCGR